MTGGWRLGVRCKGRRICQGPDLTIPVSPGEESGAYPKSNWKPLETFKQAGGMTCLHLEGSFWLLCGECGGTMVEVGRDQ